MNRGTRSESTGATRTHREWLLKLINLYPPLLGAGIGVGRVGAGRRAFEARMALTAFNRNDVGTRLGGSLYAMRDPFFALLLIEGLGPGYVVWDKAAAIRFLQPGRAPCTRRSRSPRRGSRRSGRLRTRARRSSRRSPLGR